MKINYKKFVITLVIIGSIITPLSSIQAANLSFSSSNITLSPGQSVSVSISGGSDYYASSNSNTSVATLSISGSSVNVTGVAAGTATINICGATGNLACGTITVNVNNSGSNTTTSNSGPSFSPSSVNMAPGTNQIVTISGTGSYFITNNSNAAVVSPSLNGNALSLTASSLGTASLTICQQSGGCSVLNITVNSAGNTTTGGSLLFSQTNPSIQIGQTITVTVSGGSGIYSLSSISNPSVASSSLNGNTLSITGLATGSANITVCESGGSCSIITAKVSVPSSTTNSGTTTNTVIAPVVSSLSGNVINTLLVQIQIMESQLAQLANQLAQIKLLLKGLPTTTSNATLPSASTLTMPSFYFSLNLSPGSNGNEVTALQKKLSSLGLFTDEPNVYFGPATEAAVKTFQRNNNISPLGIVGPSTRAALNK